MEMDSLLINMCIDAATESCEAIEKWRRQRRSLERLPPHLAHALLTALRHRRLLIPSLLEVFKNTLEKIDFSGDIRVDAEWMAYLGAFRYLHSLNLSGCYKLTSSAIWPVTGMSNLKELDISRCPKITDAGVKHLLSIRTLEVLSISETGVTANGVALLSSLQNLSTLDLGGLPVNDLVLDSLQVLKKLEYLDLWGSEVSNKGAFVLEMFPKLTFLNLAWTKVTKLPKLSSIAWLNMSNCTTHSIFEGHSDKVCLTKLILSGATIQNVSEAFSYLDISFLTLLDLSKSSVQEFNFLSRLVALEYLDLSFCPIENDLIGMIASIGAKLNFLNLSNTRVSSAGVGILVGCVPNLETLLLSNTQIDDLAISHLSAMPSLKVINLSSTHVRGQIQQIDSEQDTVSSLAELQNLSLLEKLDMEDTQVRDASLNPLSNFRKLNHLCLRGPLTDTSLFHFSCMQNLIHLSAHDAVFTGNGLASFSPPRTLKVMDLRGCWLLNRDDIMSFCHRNPQIEVKHELYHFLPSDQGITKHSSPSGVTTKTRQSKKKEEKLSMLPQMLKNVTFIDQRLKYSREEILALQPSSISPVLCDGGDTISEEMP